ncbi:NAD(P)H-dependent oxidoreductase [Streptomyces carpaticus]|uniref:FMN dependent NADH:quinone oxidoreductase n=2 Tax=Streptomyces TaxID=1883 RepID=A0A1I6SZZ6_9ACTN|nr:MULTISPECIES: NAD(P)H-dependent oxidoreductase [Streptomyces]MCK1816978.1 NAD(P)H-dependent oxidoreductase [Streptomyces sp. XM4011]QKV69800.1 NAD(P)H-dependent oxidoreductase [Streptomyces harbinensis]UWM50204.1 NAD(P)H-dependent oxidoreductase [Streptomyces carpaticus]SFS82337.1 FMN-dependent NADH-azoreductase [Streptomyces harbinensis]
MPTLLHIDSSLNGDNSVSREVTKTFRDAWLAQHPDGEVIYRDLSAQPLPHIDAVSYYAPNVPAEDRTPEQQASYALRDELAKELEAADAVVIGAPLYNYTIPSSLKSWLDHVIIGGRTSQTEESTVAGKPVTVVTSRGGSYAPGTPMEGNDFAQNYLQWVLGGSLRLDVNFIVPELTLARIVPAMSGLIEKADASRAEAHEQARERAKALAAA